MGGDKVRKPILKASLTVILAVCSLSWGQVDKTVVDGLISCADANFRTIRSGEASFVIKRRPTPEGKKVLPKTYQQLVSQGLPGDVVSLYLVDEVVEGRFVFSGYRFRVDGTRKRTQSADGTGTATGTDSEQIALRYNGKHFAYLAGKRKAVIHTDLASDIGDLRIPALLIDQAYPAAYSEALSEYLRRAQAEGRLKLLKVTDEPPRRTFVVKITLPSAATDLPPMHEILHFREQWGCMLIKRELYDAVPYAGRTVTWKKEETTVDTAEQVPNAGGWFPTRVRTVYWGGEVGAPLTSPLVPVAERVLEFRTMKFNTNPRGALFEADFPPGTLVENKISHTFYVIRAPLARVTTAGAVILVMLLLGFITWRWWMTRRGQT
jgi:hypothetical protein